MMYITLRLLRVLPCIVLVTTGMLTDACAESVTIPAKQERTSQINEDITAKEAFALREKNKDNPNFVVLDGRTLKEFEEGHIEDAILLDFYSETFLEELNKLDKNKTYIVHCRSGRRSKKTLNKMRELEFKEVYNLLDGMKGWKKEGLPTVR